MSRKYILARFEKDPGDEHIGDSELNISEAELQKLYGLDEPIVACYDVEPQHLNLLQTKTNHKIDLDKYDYFVEAK